jgi:hypothetical protein
MGGNHELQDVQDIRSGNNLHQSACALRSLHEIAFDKANTFCHLVRYPLGVMSQTRFRRSSSIPLKMNCRVRSAGDNGAIVYRNAHRIGPAVVVPLFGRGVDTFCHAYGQTLLLAESGNSTRPLVSGGTILINSSIFLCLFVSHLTFQGLFTRMDACQ